MFGRSNPLRKPVDRLQQLEATLLAISKSQAVIEFSPDGKVLTANPQFLAVMGYDLAEIQDQHHRTFVEPVYAGSDEYRQFWAGLNRGEYQAGEFKRLGKNGREVWIQASYNPILDRTGKPVKIIQFATDATQTKLRNGHFSGQIEAINRSQAVIEFSLDGTIITANDNFLAAMGYTLAEVHGKHHRIFVDPVYAESAEYRAFWSSLNNGTYQAAEYKRVGKNGREVWIQASYNPILDLNGRPYRVVKFATDITLQMIARRDCAKLCEAVTTSTDGMTLAIREIADSMQRSRDSTHSAVQQVESADAAMRTLLTATESMVGVIDLIKGISDRINLLSLNAAIEAASAGAAGRGFSVVATEVKSLANQSRSSADTISREIARLRSISSEVAGALSSVKNSIGSVREYVATTAAAVEEQAAVTGDICSNMRSMDTQMQRL